VSGLPDFTAFANGGQYGPLPGDIVVFDGPGAGHVAIVTGVDRPNVSIIEQNFDPSGTYILQISKNKIADRVTTKGAVFSIKGWMRPTASLSNPPTISVPIVGTLVTVPTPTVTGSFVINVTGSNFDAPTVQVYVTGFGCPAATPCVIPNNVLSNVTATTLSAPATIGVGGTYDIYVQNGSGGPTSVAWQLIVNNPTPSVSSLVPSSISIPTLPQTVSINGIGFVPTSSVAFNNLPHAVSYDSATQLTMQLTPSDVMKAGSYPIVVTNPLPVGGSSAPASLQVTNGSGNGLPIINSLSTSPDPAVMGSFTVDLIGSDFNPSDAQVYLLGGVCISNTTCLVPNNVLIQKSSTELDVPVTVNIAGTYYVYVQNGPGGASSNGLPLTVNPQSASLSITTTALSPSIATVGVVYSAQAIAASGGTTPYTWSVTGAPDGLTIDPTGGKLSGTPLASGTFGPTVTVRDSSNPQQTASRGFSLIVSSQTATLSIATVSLNPSVATTGITYTAQAITATGGTAPYTWSISGAPGGVFIDPSAAVISGVPTTPGSYNITVMLHDSSSPQQSTSKGFALSVNSQPTPLSITTTALNPSTATVGVVYSADAIVAVGGTQPYTWSVAGAPVGVSMNSTTGVISGNPTTSGTFNLTVAVHDSSSPQQSTSKSLSLPVASSATNPVINGLTTNPTPALLGQITATIVGQNYDPSSIRAYVMGGVCVNTSICSVPSNVFYSATTSQLQVPLTISDPANYTLYVQNGSGNPSNGWPLAVQCSVPVLSSIETNPSPARVGNFTVTIKGSQFNPAKMHVYLLGAVCATSSTCSVSSDVFIQKSTNLIEVPITGNVSGDFQVYVQNSLSCGSSNPLPLTINP
jgi:hypothetical protein